MEQGPFSSTHPRRPPLPHAPASSASAHTQALTDTAPRPFPGLGWSWVLWPGRFGCSPTPTPGPRTPSSALLSLSPPTHFSAQGVNSRGRGAELISLSRSLPHLGSNRGDSESGDCDRAPGLGSGRGSMPKATTLSSPSPGTGHHHPSLSGLPQLSHHALLSFPDPSALGVVTRFGLNLGKRRRGKRRVCPGQGAHSAPPPPRSRSCC